MNLLNVLALAPVLLALLATFLAWRRIARRALFLVVALLCFSGLQLQIEAMALDLFPPQGALLTPELVSVGCAALIGGFVLAWLGRALRADGSSSSDGLAGPGA
jgi:hypothetical protein